MARKKTGTPFLNKNKLPAFLEEFIGAAAKTLDKLDLMDNDNWLSTLPFGKVAGLAMKKIVEISDEARALSHAVGFASGMAFRQALVRYKIPLHLSAHRERIFRQQLRKLLKEEVIDLAAFSLDDFWDSELVRRYRALYLDLLKHGDVDAKQQLRVVNYLRDFARIVFLRLLEEHEAVYYHLAEYLESRSYLELQLQHRHERYRTELKNLYTEVVLNDPEGMTLDAVYIQPRFGLYEKCLVEGDYQTEEKEKAFVPAASQNYRESIHPFVLDWLQGSCPDLPLLNKQVRFLLVYGYPGQGKTSFCKRLLYDVFGEHPLGQEVYFLKFKNFKQPGDLKNDCLKVIRDYLQDQHDLEVDKKELRRSLLVLDGLDELLMKNKLQKSDIENILRELIREVEQHGNLRMIVTSRYGYVHLGDIPKENALVLQLGELDLEQQKNWLRIYREFHPKSKLTPNRLEKINGEESYLKELITQPILLHMIASLQEEIDFKASRATIYGKLFDQITRPGWKEGQIDQLKGLEARTLRRYVRELAFEIFRSGESYLHKSRIESLDATRSFKAKLKDISFQDALKTLMVAFYFQEIPKKGGPEDKEDDFDYAIEFLHKSLYEYLATEKIWTTLSNTFLHKDLEGEYSLESRSKALAAVDALMGDQRLTEELVIYLEEIIAETKIDKKELATRLSHFLSYFLKKDFVFRYDSNQQGKVIHRALHAFYAFWTILSNLQPGTNYLEDTEDQEHFAYLLELLSRRYHKLNLRGAKLIGAKLIGADLRGADLRGADLRGADLRGADLRGADLRGADLRRADLRGADLRGAKLRRANLYGAILIETILMGAKLIGANLSKANLYGADLIGAILYGANLYGANLREACLRETYLSRVNLDGVRSLQSEQITQAKSLYEAKNIPPEILTRIQKEAPHLLENPEE